MLEQIKVWIEAEYIWLAIGILLIGLEAAAPGIFMLWFGLAAIVTAGVVFIIPGLSLTMQIGIFAVLSIISALFAWKFIGKKDLEPEDNVNLNDRAGQLVGKRITLENPIRNGTGHAFIDDTRWTLISEKDLNEGSVVEISAVANNGDTLRVKIIEEA